MAKHHAATLVLSGHTPSLVGYEQLRASALPLPVFHQPALPEHIDVAKERQVGLAGLVSLELEQRLRTTSDGISFLYLNQRGTAQCIMCKDCRYTYRCPICTSTLTYHARGNRLSCHSCGHEQKLGSCPECDGVMVGRGIFGNPWFFSGKVLADISPKDRLTVMLEHAKAFDKKLGDVKNFAIMKKHFKAYVSGWDGAKELRVKLMETENIQDVDNLVKEYLKNF
jgi:hypothetical protein